MKHELPAFAVLIDADNITANAIPLVLAEITRHARVTVRRIYGDFTTSNLAAWKTHIAEHAIQPVQQYRNTVGKNASDSALIIDAMDLLHSHRFEGFCLVSSDSDFTRLATRIREDGLEVYGFGEKKAPKAFVNACDRYIYIENLQPAIATAPEAQTVSEITAIAPALPTSATPIENSGIPKFSIKACKEAQSILLRAHTNVADEQGWAMLGQLSSYIHANHPDFDPRSYGCAKFIDLVQKSEAFELLQRPYKNGQSYFCRPEKSFPQVTKTRADFQTSLTLAVQNATGKNGWASISIIGQQLKALGRTLKESGSSTLCEALTSTSLFEMKGSGAARYFRLKPKI